MRAGPYEPSTQPSSTKPIQPGRQSQGLWVRAWIAGQDGAEESMASELDRERRRARKSLESYFQARSSLITAAVRSPKHQGLGFRHRKDPATAALDPLDGHAQGAVWSGAGLNRTAAHTDRSGSGPRDRVALAVTATRARKFGPSPRRRGRSKTHG